VILVGPCPAPYYMLVLYRRLKYNMCVKRQMNPSQGVLPE
jgi:hypothetical protein